MIADSFRLCFGTLTVLPVAPPHVVNRRTGGWAMVLAPLVGLVLALLAGSLVLLLDGPPFLEATLAIGLLALLTRAMHLDGLADTADGLGSGKPAGAALTIMKRSDIGPFGVVTLVLVLLLQVLALGQQVALGRGGVALCLALLASRLVLPLVCSRGIPAARPDGLGQVVAGSVSRAQLAVSALLVALVLPTALAIGTPRHLDVGALVNGVLVVVAALVVGLALCGWCVRRLGGVTGDVLGGCVEATFTAVLVLLCLTS